MKTSSLPRRAAIACLFALIPAATASGALALPVLLSLAGAACLTTTRLRQVFEIRALPVWLLILFTAWAAVSVLWSNGGHDEQALKLAALVALGLLFTSGATLDLDGKAMLWAGGVGALLVLIPLLGEETLTNMALNRAAQPGQIELEIGRNASRGATVLMGLGWGVCAGLIAFGGVRAIAGLCLLVGCAALAPQFGQTVNLVAFPAGLAAFGLAYLAPRLTPLLVCGGLAFWVLAAPVLTPLLIAGMSGMTLPYSWEARLGIWNYVCGRILEQPLLGHGLEASRAVTERMVIQGHDIRAVPAHPHSASLQIWFETGGIGAVLAAAALITGGLALSRAFAANRPAAAAASATLVSLGIVANLSFGLWAEWWIATMFIAAALVGAITVKS